MEKTTATGGKWFAPQKLFNIIDQSFRKVLQVLYLLEDSYSTERFLRSKVRTLVLEFVEQRNHQVTALSPIIDSVQQVNSAPSFKAWV